MAHKKTLATTRAFSRASKAHFRHQPRFDEFGFSRIRGILLVCKYLIRLRQEVRHAFPSWSLPISRGLAQGTPRGKSGARMTAVRSLATEKVLQGRANIPASRLPARASCRMRRSADERGQITGGTFQNLPGPRGDANPAAGPSDAALPLEEDADVLPLPRCPMPLAARHALSCGGPAGRASGASSRFWAPPWRQRHTSLSFAGFADLSTDRQSPRASSHVAMLGPLCSLVQGVAGPCIARRISPICFVAWGRARVCAGFQRGAGRLALSSDT